MLPERPAGFDIVQNLFMRWTQCGMPSALDAADNALVLWHKPPRLTTAAVIDTVSMTARRLHTNTSVEAFHCLESW